MRLVSWVLLAVVVLVAGTRLDDLTTQGHDPRGRTTALSQQIVDDRVSWVDGIARIKESASGVAPELISQVLPENQPGLMTVLNENPSSDGISAIIAVMKHDRDDGVYEGITRQIDLLCMAFRDDPEVVGWEYQAEQDGTWTVLFWAAAPGLRSYEPRANLFTFDPATGSVEDKTGIG